MFDCADDAIAASVEAQRALAAEQWPGGLALRVRMGVHAGEIYEVDGEPVGLTINQGARIMAVAEPGQVVVSSAAMTAAAPCAGPAGVAAVQYPVADAGWHTLRDHLQPVRLRQVVADGLTVVPPADRVIDLTDPAAFPGHAQLTAPVAPSGRRGAGRRARRRAESADRVDRGGVVTCDIRLRCRPWHASTSLIAVSASTSTGR